LRKRVFVQKGFESETPRESPQRRIEVKGYDGSREARSLVAQRDISSGCLLVVSGGV